MHVWARLSLLYNSTLLLLPYSWNNRSMTQLSDCRLYNTHFVNKHWHTALYSMLLVLTLYVTKYWNGISCNRYFYLQILVLVLVLNTGTSNARFLLVLVSLLLVMLRVVSSEISGNFPRKISRNFRKFIPIFSEISGNLLMDVFFHFILFNYNHIKINNKHVFLQTTLQIFLF